jgi:hypothetical protein
VRGPFRCSIASYRLLLLAYPAGFRRRFGPAMREDFTRLLDTHGRWDDWRRSRATWHGPFPTHTPARAAHERMFAPTRSFARGGCTH